MGCVSVNVKQQKEVIGGLKCKNIVLLCFSLDCVTTFIKLIIIINVLFLPMLLLTSVRLSNIKFFYPTKNPKQMMKKKISNGLCSFDFVLSWPPPLFICLTRNIYTNLFSSSLIQIAIQAFPFNHILLTM